ncbi:MAG: hypothetical protein JWO74_2922 [Solirubrobacterales bacterium]|jgi:uncharacterized protein YkwD|nr:hypothetical protein [Solirubrobacterales bacterium]
MLGAMRPARLAALLTLSATAAVGAFPAIVPAAGACGGQSTARALGQEGARAALLCVVNEQRAQRGLPAVASSLALRSAAQGHTDDMVARAYFGHVGTGEPGLADRVGATGYLSHRYDWFLGEALGWAEGAAATPDHLMNAWMASPPHQAVILDPRYRDLGVGVDLAPPAAGVKDGVTVTLDFGLAR